MPANPQMPTDVDHRVPWFDHAAEYLYRFSSSAVFFLVTALAILAMIGVGSATAFDERWFRIVHVVIAVPTFLMVALLENASRRSRLAVQHKLNAQTLALLALLGERGPAEVRRELEHSLDVEHRETAAGVTQ